MPNQQDSVYRELHMEMRNGLKQIYKQLSSAHLEGEAVQQEALFTEASDQLKEVVKATETAAMDIMDIVEKQLDSVMQSEDLLVRLQERYPNEPGLATLVERVNNLDADLTKVLTALSFQDITGQRIKRVMDALAAIESRVVDLYLSSGLAIADAEQNPEKKVQQIQQDADQAVTEYKKKSQLKGPSKGAVSQAAIDDMLNQLGL